MSESHSRKGKLPLAPRRVPTQERSRARVGRILKAAAEVFDAQGYEGATTDAIARAAGVPIGSLYQFFPNKGAILQALAHEVMAELEALFEAHLTPALVGLPVEDLVSGFLDLYLRYARERPGLRAVTRGVYADAQLTATAFSFNDEYAERLALLFAPRSPGVSTGRRLAVARVLVYTADAVLELAVRRGGEEAVVAEARLMMVAYLKTLFTEAPAGPQ